MSPPSGGQSNWAEYQNLVMNMLTENRDRIDALQNEIGLVRREEIGELKTKLAVLTVKMSAIAVGVTLLANTAAQIFLWWVKSYAGPTLGGGG